MTPTEWKKYIKETVIGKHEKGYQDDPDDKGNYLTKNNETVGLIGTKFGISANVLQEHTRHEITADDMKNLTMEKAVDIYMKDYVYGPKINQLPNNLQKNVFDMAVNSGAKKAIIVLQEAIKDKAAKAGHNIKDEEFSVDGRWGKNTSSFLKMFPVSSNDYTDARIKKYESMVEADPIKEKYLKGWKNRAESYRDSEQDQDKVNKVYEDRKSFEDARQEQESSEIPMIRPEENPEPPQEHQIPYTMSNAMAKEVAKKQLKGK